MAAPIWKDYDVDLAPYLAGGVVDFTIEHGGNVIYAGRAVEAPDGSCAVRINDICAAFLHQSLPPLPTGGAEVASATPPALSGEFDIYAGDTLADTVTFLDDWSYNDIVRAYPSGVLNDPVHDWVLDGQPLPVTLNGIAGAVEVGGVTTAFGSLGQDVNAVLRFFDADHTGATFTLTAGDWTKTFKLRTDVCWRYGLLYVNAFGGWDFLPMTGTATKSDTYDRTGYDRRINNADRSARGAVTLAAGIARRWTLRTGILTDAESDRMAHLLGSPDVYLFDVQDTGLQPVSVVNSECDYKTFRTANGGVVEYAVTVALAQPRNRR